MKNAEYNNYYDVIHYKYNRDTMSVIAWRFQVGNGPGPPSWTSRGFFSGKVTRTAASTRSRNDLNTMQDDFNN